MGIPAAPAVIWPISGGTVRTTTPRIHWTGDAHTSYEVHVNTANDPNSGIVWDSGAVSSSANFAVSGALTDHYHRRRLLGLFCRFADGEYVERSLAARR